MDRTGIEPACLEMKGPRGAISLRPVEQDELKDNRHESNERLDPKRDESRREDRAGVLTIPVPIVHGAPVIVEFPGKIGEDDWIQFIAVLTAMKPGLIARPEPE